MGDNLKLGLIGVLIFVVLVFAYNWWYSAVPECQGKGGVPVRGIGYNNIVCIDASAVVNGRNR